ncbi:hypothetical protein [Haladaptatus sp. R4]|uniref:hypothetical protein n=1 Tax=Haladaptatus sp. R4 TaxID=1679489 RepID=UPI001CC030A6|nr:hypothetical protein [Haladaptatus sp. R4]
MDGRPACGGLPRRVERLHSASYENQRLGAWRDVRRRAERAVSELRTRNGGESR